MKKFILGLIVGAVVFIPVSAFAQQKVFDVTLGEVQSGSGGYIHRWDDPQFQVKCWELKDGYGGGLDCLPWSEIKER